MSKPRKFLHTVFIDGVKYYRPKKAAELLDVSVQTIGNWRNAKILRGMLVPGSNRNYLMLAEDIDLYKSEINP